MVAAHLAEDQRGDAATAVIGMRSDAAEIAAYSVTFAHLRERTRVADDKTVVNGNDYGLIEMCKYCLFPSRIIDRIEKLGKSVVKRGIIICYLDSALLKRSKLSIISFGQSIARKRHII